ncbi:uncharacterized protein Yka (UPF0111/DUF47 family) [Halarchaeum rubridurum]|uniref:Uncharacterized protein Yka (UPF0111/DUF47 family) n=1 Tax=Halarchaeum rubridurum TaxID=489911 RepID=A0A830FRM7_9EURY|nr:DUF47 family protein [Halarchaeum rubridurum]MBP1953481.1 uncharacterized protein Yka (UPF0111/DUF47 family) [Halarchaeum rubridurum]GGM64900.1 hypothetical protein GCM10009017_13770 [Halarchaeum rubridurum]
MVGDHVEGDAGTDTDADLADAVSAFCEGVRDCTAHLPVAVAAYGDGETGTFHESAAAAAATESACDDRARDVRDGLVALDPALTGVYLRARDLLELLSRIDAVANAVEDALAALAAMEPDVEGVAETLVSLADRAAECAARLCDAVEGYVAALCDDRRPSVEHGDLDAVRDLEDRCDDLKRPALAAAFAPGLSVNGLALREVVLALDAVPNAVEDAADHFSFVVAATV